MRVAVLLSAWCVAAAVRLRIAHRDPDSDDFVREVHDNANYTAAVKSTKKPESPLEKDFISLDTDHDGYLSEQELMFRQYTTGCEPLEAQVRGRDYMKCGDLNKDGYISLQEFNASTQPAWAECIKDTSDRRVHGFVRFFDADTDYDDKLSPKELRIGMMQLWGSPGEELVDPLMGCADKDKDGFLNQAEFHDSIAAYNPATRSWQVWNGTSDPGVVACMGEAFKRFDAALVFQATDANKDRKLSRQEAYNTMRAVNGIKLPQATADAIFDAADADKNKYLNLDEFIAAGEAHKGATEAAGFFLSGRAGTSNSTRRIGAYPLDNVDEGYGMSIECHGQDGQPWRLFSDALGRVRVEPTDTAGGVKVTQR